MVPNTNLMTSSIYQIHCTLKIWIRWDSQAKEHERREGAREKEGRAHERKQEDERREGAREKEGREHERKQVQIQ